MTNNIPLPINCGVCRDKGPRVPSREWAESEVRRGRTPKSYCIICNESYPLSKEGLEYTLSQKQ